MFIKSNWKITLWLALLLSASPVIAVDLDPANPMREDCSSIRLEGQNLSSSKSRERTGCMNSNAPITGVVTNCKGTPEYLAWPMCDHFLCEINDLEQTYGAKYDACMDKVKVAEDEKRRQEAISKAEKRKQDKQERKEAQAKERASKQFDKVRELADFISNPRKFLEKALRKNPDAFNLIFPTDDDKDINTELANETYKYAYNAAKYGVKYANENKTITAIQQNSLKLIDQHFKRTFNELDKALANMDRLNNQAQQSANLNSRQEPSNRKEEKKYKKAVKKAGADTDACTQETERVLSCNPDSGEDCVRLNEIRFDCTIGYCVRPEQKNCVRR